MQSGGSPAFPAIHLAPTNTAAAAAAAAPSRTLASGPPSASNSANIGYLPAVAAPRASAVPASIAPAPMPVPLVPYPPQPQMIAPPPGAQGQLLCTGCRTLLLYPQGASNVRCALCSSITAVSPHGADVAQLICGCCRTLLMYARGATSVQCSCCSTVNLAMEANQIAHVNCGGCGTMLMYPYGAQSVKCALCQFVNSTGMNNIRMPPPAQRPTFMPPPLAPQTSQPISRTQTQTVVVENPMTLDESGKLVSNVAVGVTTEKK